MSKKNRNSAKKIEEKVEDTDETVEETVEETADEESDEIVVKDPMILRPKVLPLVVTLPKSASGAQVEYAKLLNAYAYQNPEKWAVKKDSLIVKLKSYKSMDELPKDQNLTIGSKNKLSA